MYKYEYYHFLSAKEDVENGIDKLVNGEKLALVEIDATIDVFNMVIDFIANEGILENEDTIKEKIKFIFESKYTRDISNFEVENDERFL